MYDTHILTDVGCRNTQEKELKTGYALNLTINYYRGLAAVLCGLDFPGGGWQSD